MVHRILETTAQARIVMHRSTEVVLWKVTPGTVTRPSWSRSLRPREPSAAQHLCWSSEPHRTRHHAAATALPPPSSRHPPCTSRAPATPARQPSRFRKSLIDCSETLHCTMHACTHHEVLLVGLDGEVRWSVENGSLWQPVERIGLGVVMRVHRIIIHSIERDQEAVPTVSGRVLQHKQRRQLHNQQR